MKNEDLQAELAKYPKDAEVWFGIPDNHLECEYCGETSGKENIIILESVEYNSKEVIIC